MKILWNCFFVLEWFLILLTGIKKISTCNFTIFFLLFHENGSKQFECHLHDRECQNGIFVIVFRDFNIAIVEFYSWQSFLLRYLGG